MRLFFKRRALAALLVSAPLVLLLSACGEASPREGDADLELRLTLDPDPPQVGAGSVRVDVADVQWRPRNGLRVILTGTRDGVDLVVDTARGEGAGTYVAPDFRFEVAGDWVLRTRVETPEGHWTEEEHPVEVVAGES